MLIIMFETLIITFREGLEAFLIVAIMAAYLMKTGRGQLMTPLFAGIGAALLISATTGWHVAELAEDPIWEGWLALSAGALVASFTIFIMMNAKNIRGNLHDLIDIQAQKTGVFAAIGVFIFTTLMIAREGMETALMLGAISAQTDAMNMWIGALLGLVSVAVIGFLWVTQSNRINLKLFMQVTGIFLILFAIDLFIYGVHELSEMYAIPFVGQGVNEFLHINTEMFGHGSIYSQIVTYGLLVVPAGWLILSYLSDKMKLERSTA
jgi:high-affinity iron transporter